ncbi:MAG TPA: hypothetical protein PKA38_05430 [Candidatus Levybacteria bacterium]|nr:hypothetical protein [Candidatus Levybacteria bacterium]
MKKLIGIFNPRRLTPEQIYEKAMKTLQEKERLELIEMAKKRSVEKNKE